MVTELPENKRESKQQRNKQTALNSFNNPSFNDALYILFLR
jgi:hypothetical protein